MGLIITTPEVGDESAEAALWEMSLDMLATANLDGYLSRVNPAWELTLGYSVAEITSQPYLDLVHPDDVAKTMSEAQRLFAPPYTCVGFENRYRAKNGQYHRLSWTCRTVPGGTTIYAVVRDVTLIRDAEAERDDMHRLLREREQLLDGVLESAPIGLAVTTLYGRLLRSNRALREITGYGDAELRQMSSLQVITHPDDIQAKEAEVRVLSGPDVSSHRSEKRLIHSHGKTVSVEYSSSLVCDANGDPTYMVLQIQDISQRKNLEERLRYFADMDTLTGMRNRRLFEDDLHNQVARCQRYGEHAALLVLDLDGFKKINDTYGHKVGDEMLKAVAAALMRRVRTGDRVARLGGDEFAILLTNVSCPEAEAIAADFAQVVVGAVVNVGDEALSCRASIGVACIDEHAVDDDTVFATADTSMYGVKRAAQRALRG